jgi:hypothetical protein
MPTSHTEEHTKIAATSRGPFGGRAVRPWLLPDLLSDLLWPRMLRSATMALRPQRWIFSTIMLVIAGLVIKAAQGTGSGRAWLGLLASGFARGVDETRLAWDRGSTVDVASALARAGRGLLVEPHIAFPLTAICVMVLLILLWSIGGAAVCRMVAVEYGNNKVVPWPEALAFGIRRWSAAATAMLIAPATAGIVCFVMAAAGWMLLSWPVVQVAGAVVYPIFLIGAACSALLLVGGILGHVYFCPAVAAENADGLDAFQRSLAYVVAAPLRMFAYIAIGVVQAVIATVLLLIFASWTSGIASWSATRWISHGEPGAEAGWSQQTADGLISMWSNIPMLLVGGFVVSSYFAISTIVFLLVRERADGRDAADLWMPGKRGTTLTVSNGPPMSGGEGFDEPAGE